MSTSNQDINYDLMLTQWNALFGERIATALKSGILPYLNFSDLFIEKSKKCESNCLISIKNNALQAYLHGNAGYCDAIYTLLDEAIHATPGMAFGNAMDSLDEQAFKILEGIPETKAFTKKINTVFSVPKPRSKLAKFFVSLLKKGFFSKQTDKEGNPFIRRLRNYPNRALLFRYLVLENFVSAHEKYDKLYENIAELITFLWQLDVARQKKFEELTEKNYSLDTNSSYIISAEDIEKAGRLNKSVVDSYELIVEALSSNTKRIIYSLKDEKSIEAEALNNDVQIERDFKQLLASYSKTTKNWNNTVYILSEDWKLELEIRSLQFGILKGYFEFAKIVETNFSLPVEENLSLINKSLKDLKTEVEAIHDEQGFAEKLNKSKTEIRRKLVVKLSPVLRDIILKSNVPNAIDSYQINLLEKFDKISSKRYLVKNLEYNKPVSSSEFESISPNDMLAYEILPKFKGVFPELKTGFIRHVQKFQNQVTEVSEIIDFAIESSVAFFEKEKKLDEAIKISTDGISRAEKKLDEINKLHANYLNSGVKKIQGSMEGFIKEILEITNNENAFQIKMKVARLKAIENSKIVKERVLLKIRNFIPIALEHLNKSFAFVRTYSERITKHFLSEPARKYIASDTSDYLAETEKAIDKLPYVYQRLFKIEPLATFELYVERKQRLEELSNAYYKWKAGKFAPVVVVGEKGSGKTTFINRFLKTRVHNEKVILIDLHLAQGTPEALYESIIQEKVIAQSLDESNKSEDRSIVIVDGLERLFTSEINGFQYLLKTMLLISDTNSSIFWIFSCHIYSFFYIDKTCNISDYFGYHIKLDELTPDNLRDIIEKRHNISGYNLQFEPAEEKKIMMSFKKVSDDNKQAGLKGAYFNSLSAYNNGNIAQAFLYWLRSTTGIKDDIIHLRQISEMNNNFVKSISKEKMVTLRSVLIHNGISVADHARMFREKPELSRLHLDQMMDDGILVIMDGRYFLNPLIYSQIISNFYKLNLLH